MGFVGDSKTAVVNGSPWVESLIANMNTDYNSSPGVYFEEDAPRNWAVGGYASVDLASHIDAWLLTHTVKSYADHNVFLLNVGSGDLVVGTAEADFKTAALYVIDAIKVQYPNAVCFVDKTWRRGYDAAALTMAGWVDDIVAARSTFCYVGADENDWVKGVDDGATMSYDGAHYSEAGMTGKEVAIRARLLAVLGY